MCDYWRASTKQHGVVLYGEMKADNEKQKISSSRSFRTSTRSSTRSIKRRLHAFAVESIMKTLTLVVVWFDSVDERYILSISLHEVTADALIIIVITVK